MIDVEAQKQFRDIVGKERFSTAREDLVCYSYDAANLPYLPDAVIFPLSEAEVVEIIKTAFRYNIPVFPRGAGSGFTGGSLPVKGGLVVCMAKMDRIINIDEDNLTVEVEPGVITEKLQQAVEKKGLFYPPDPASLKFSTIGGNIAECSGGPRAAKYGVTRDYLLSVNIVTPPGIVIKSGAKTAKSVVGFDLTRLIAGSEGTLGIITKATLKLIPMPEQRQCILALFKSIRDAATTVSELTAARIIPSTLEFMDYTCIKTVSNYLNLGIPDECKALLLIEVDGSKEDVASKSRKAEEICRRKNPVDIRTASTNEEMEKLWTVRRGVSSAIGRLSKTKINEDITVPRNKIPDILDEVYKIADKYRLSIICFGHAGDGNIHTNIMTDRENKEEMGRVEKAVEEIFAATLKAGGTISGEHGIGITKSPYISMELNQEYLNLMWRVKKSFDPTEIMNPGKVFPPDFVYTPFLV
ncbi:MAG: FAD-binding protein [Candidatus Schekmanbacteria bacterium]|nr:FAD-binding protein [Candidatus Schekmanbacteria bacterium]